MMIPKYKIGDIQTMLCMPRRRISFYREQGLFPTVAGGGNRGNPFLYTQSDLTKFMALEILAECGINIKQIKKLFSNNTIDIILPKAKKIYSLMHGRAYQMGSK